MESFHEKTAAHQTAIDTLAKVKEAEKQIQRTNVPIRNEHGRVVGYRLVKVGYASAPPPTALDTDPNTGRKPQIPPIAEPMEKQCATCNVVKPLADFSPDKKNKDGRCSACKVCVETYVRERYAATRGVVSAKKAPVEPSANMQGIEHLTASIPCAPYNVKGFLLPDSIRSCASYHAKILENGEYLFRIHDCVTGIRLRGDLNDPEQLREAIDKLEALASACTAFAHHIKQQRNARR